MNNRSGNTWTKLVLALGLMCVTFSFGAMAQTNVEKPLDKAAVSALLGELKAGLPDLTKDEDQVNAITEKWDAREDLAGKTRKQVLGLLFADLKAVVTDKETQDSVWAAWNDVQQQETEPTTTDPPVQEPKPAVKSGLEPYWLELRQNGAYMADFTVTWDEPGAPGKKQEARYSAGSKMRVNFAGDATNIRIHLRTMSGWVIVDKVLQPNELNKAYQTVGHAIGPTFSVVQD